MHNIIQVYLVDQLLLGQDIVRLTELEKGILLLQLFGGLLERIQTGLGNKFDMFQTRQQLILERVPGEVPLFVICDDPIHEVHSMFNADVAKLLQMLR